MWIWELDHKEGWAPKNWHFWTMVLEKILESPLAGKEIKPVNPKLNQSWIFMEGLMLKLQHFGHLLWRSDSWKRPWCWQRLRAEREGDDRGWDGGMASPTQWTWVWESSGSWWWTGKPGVLQSMGSWRAGQTEWLNWRIFWGWAPASAWFKSSLGDSNMQAGLRIKELNDSYRYLPILK